MRFELQCLNWVELRTLAYKKPGDNTGFIVWGKIYRLFHHYHFAGISIVLGN